MSQGVGYNIGPNFRAKFCIDGGDRYITWTWDNWATFTGMRVDPRRFFEARQAVQARDMTKFMEVVE